MIQVVLQVKNANANVKELVVRETTVIGRGSDCGLRIASVEVSRKHCKIEILKDKATITDLGSSNGTYLNSQKLTPKLAKPLVSSSIIQIGPLEATIQIRKADEKNQIAPKPVKQPVIQDKPVNKLNENDATVAMDPMTAKRAERKKVDDTLPMAPNMQELFNEALEYEAKENEELQLKKSSPVERHVVQSTPAVDQAIELELVDDDIVQDSSPGIDIMIESDGSDIILLEETSTMVPDEPLISDTEDADQDIADFLKNLKDDV
jgi:pSer/pThr/pTyr-binding forkhead associated (FHA) protein